jgi:hypothetical protein
MDGSVTRPEAFSIPIFCAVDKDWFTLLAEKRL